MSTSLRKLDWMGFGALAFGLLPAAADAQAAFDGAVNIPVLSDPERTALGDWDQDGDLDLAVTSDAPDKVSLFLNAGDGTFVAGSNIPFASSSSPHGIVAGDFDGDGMTDLAVTRQDRDDVQIAFNLGSATFSLGAAYGVGVRPIHVATQSLDGNTSLDLVVVNRSGDSVSVLLNLGTGTFATATTYATGTEPRDVAIADLDGDATLDLAVAAHDTSALVLLSNDGSGAFSPWTTLSMGAIKPEGVAAADLDDDGDSDLVGSGSDDARNLISVFLQTGPGSFGAATNYSTGGTDPGGVVTGDFDLDADRDVAVTNQSSGNVGVLANDGNGAFAAAVMFGTDQDPEPLIVGDFDGNGADDLVTTNTSANSISVLLNQNMSAFTDLGHALAGTNGLPHLHGTGTLRGGTNVRLTVTNGLPATSGFLIIGASAINAPFAGGTLVPAPDLFLPIALDGAGGLVVEGNWPTGITPGVSVYFQTWLFDAGAVKRLAATNALEGVTQ